MCPGLLRTRSQLDRNNRYPPPPPTRTPLYWEEEDTCAGSSRNKQLPVMHIVGLFSHTVGLFSHIVGLYFLVKRARARALSLSLSLSLTLSGLPACQGSHVGGASVSRTLVWTPELNRDWVVPPGGFPAVFQVIYFYFAVYCLLATFLLCLRTYSAPCACVCERVCVCVCVCVCV